MKDSRGKETKTLVFVTITWFCLVVKFIFAGLTMPWGLGMMPVMDAGSFGLASAAVLGIWLGREWQEKIASKRLAE